AAEGDAERFFTSLNNCLLVGLLLGGKLDGQRVGGGRKLTNGKSWRYRRRRSRWWCFEGIAGNAIGEHGRASYNLSTPSAAVVLASRLVSAETTRWVNMGSSSKPLANTVQNSDPRPMRQNRGGAIGKSGIFY